MTSPEPGSFLAELAPAERAELLNRGYDRHWAPGATLFHEGDTSTWVAVLLSGRVKACSDGVNGGEVVLAIRGAGALLGEISAIDTHPRSATVRAMEPVKARILQAEEFTAFLQEYPRVGLQLMRMICERWRDSDRKRIEFGMLDTTSRVAQRLVELAERYGEPDANAVRIDISLTQEELAGWVGSSREAVSKALRSLRSRGWIETGRRTVVIHDLPSLRRRVR